MKKLLIPVISGLLFVARDSEMESSLITEEVVNDVVENTDVSEIIEVLEEYVPMDMNFRKLQEILIGLIL